MLRTGLLSALLGTLTLACGSDGSSGSGGTGAQAGSGGAGGSGASSGAAGSSGSAGSGGNSGNAGSGGSSGSAGTGGSAGSSGSGGSAGSAGACGATPGTIACGAEVCDLKTQFCCGGPGGVCMALGAFCGAGGLIRLYCDDSADCAAGEICCPGEVSNPGNDAQFETTCRTPEPPGPNTGPYGCGKTGGNFDYPNLCSCDADCAFGTCQSGSIYTTDGQSYLRCE
jgi:hypothetical protein